MNFGFSEEQDLLRQEIRKFLAAKCPLEEVRQIMSTPEGYSKEQWSELAEMGWLGLIIPEQYGGVGLGFEDLVVLLEEAGRTLFPSPLLSSSLAAAVILDAGSAAQKEKWLPRIADGSCIATVAYLESSDEMTSDDIQLGASLHEGAYFLTGEKRYVANALQADLVIVAARTGEATDAHGLFLVERSSEGIKTSGVELIDRTKRSGHIRFNRAKVPKHSMLGEAGAAWPAICRHMDRGAIMISAEVIGAYEGALQMTVRFAKDRIQFGKPIGQFQGVKHPLAERYVDVESLKSLVYHAAWALDASHDEVPLAASKAKAMACVSFLEMGVVGIQLHGAVGYTEEYDIQLYLRRSKWARPQFGDEDHHYDRIASMGDI